MFNSLNSHISMLHKFAKGIDGLLILASFGENIPPIIRHYKAGDADAMAKDAIELSEQQGRNVYAPLAVMRPDLPKNAKGTEQDIIATLGFVADFDHGRGANYPSRCPVKPSYVLETSPSNAQCFFMFEKPLLINNETDRARVKNLVSQLTQSSLEADPIGADLSHVWRIPDLKNYPNVNKIRDGRDPNPFIVKVLEPFAEGFVSETAIQDLKPFVKPDSKEKDGNTKLEYKKTVNLNDLLKQGKQNLVSTIINGVSEGERSEAAASVVWQLLDLGYCTGDIYDLIVANPKGIGERYKGNKERIEAEILRLYNKRLQKKNESQAETPKLPFTLRSFKSELEFAIPRREWIFGNYLLKGYVTVLIAPAGVGKSTVSITWGLSIVTGKNLFDTPVHEAGAVAFINNEDDANEMQRRITAIKKFHTIADNELEDKLFIQTGDQQQLVIASRDPHTKKISPQHKDDLIRLCLENKIKVLFVDPFLETHEADENDNRQINEVAKMYREVAQKANCAVCLVHHTRKQQGQSSSGHAGNMDSGRGASSLVGVARVVVTIESMSTKDADKYGIPEEKRNLYLRVDEAKANLSLVSNQIKWYCRETVLLNNGDSVGVLRVAHNLRTALADSKSVHENVLLQKVKFDAAFIELREKGSVTRDVFIQAMFQSRTYLGDVTEARSTLQGRVAKALLDDGISAGNAVLYMKKKKGRYIVYLELDNADMPDHIRKISASQADQEIQEILPTSAEIHSAIAHKPSEILDAELPPL